MTDLSSSNRTFYLATKEKMLAAARDDLIHNRLEQGFYEQQGLLPIDSTRVEESGFRGCFVGCALRALGHERYNDHSYLADAVYGGDIRLAFLTDALFENMRLGDAKGFPLRLLNALPEGVDPRLAVDRFILAVLDDPNIGVANYEQYDASKATRDVAHLYKRRLAGRELTEEEWQDAAEDASIYNAPTAAAAARSGRDDLNPSGQISFSSLGSMISNSLYRIEAAGGHRSEYVNDLASRLCDELRALRFLPQTEG